MNGDEAPEFVVIGKVCNQQMRRGERPWCVAFADLDVPESEAGFSVLLGDAPLGFQPALLLHAVQGRVERAFLDAEQVARDALHVGGDRKSVV